MTVILIFLTYHKEWSDEDDDESVGPGTLSCKKKKKKKKKLQTERASLYEKVVKSRFQN